VPPAHCQREMLVPKEIGSMFTYAPDVFAAALKKSWNRENMWMQSWEGRNVKLPHHPSDIALCCNDRHARELPWTEDACGDQNDLTSDEWCVRDLKFRTFRRYRAQCRCVCVEINRKTFVCMKPPHYGSDHRIQPKYSVTSEYAHANGDQNACDLHSKFDFRNEACDGTCL
jgi:hypothetical protein